jgi:tetratricopeptide (TPR) repeat protein
VRAFTAAHETLDEAERLLDRAGPRARVRSLLERGRVINSAGEPERAAPSFVAAWELARTEGEDALAVDAAHMLGIVLPPPSGLEWTRRALALAETSADARARRWQGSLLNNLGWTFHDAGDFATALGLFSRATSWQDEHGTIESRRVARWCVARTLRSLGRVTEALDRQQALHDELTTAGQEDGFVDEEIGECLLALGRI